MEKENLINAYFEGRLTDEQNLEFQELLRSDAVFLQDFTFQKNLKKAIATEERAALKKQLESFDKKPSARTFPMKWIAVAASFVLLVALGSLLFYNHKPDYENLYTENFREFPNLSHPVVRSGTAENETDKAFSAYDKKDYKNAVVWFSKIGNNEALFYKGISEMSIGEYQNAANDFSKINKENFPLKEHLMWYEALNYLKTGNAEKAKDNLKLLENNRIYKEKAEELLSELD